MLWDAMGCRGFFDDIGLNKKERRVAKKWRIMFNLKEIQVKKVEVAMTGID